MRKPLIVACIPAYNEEKNIAKVIVKVKNYVDEVIVYDDGSRDMTADIAESLGAIVVKSNKNKGYGAAIKYLLMKARDMNADIAITIDGDGQHDPDEISKVIKPILDGEADIVIGSRFINNHTNSNISKHREIGIKAITKAVNIVANNDIKDSQSGFRAYSKKALHSLQLGEYGMGISTEILVKAKWNNLRIKEVPVTIIYHKDSHTHNALYHGFDVLINTIKFVTLKHPLLSYGIPGFVFLGIALFFWIWTFDIFANTRQLITNIALVAIGSTIVGLILLVTSVILWTITTIVREK